MDDIEVARIDPDAERLAGWRDALVASGFPTPTLDRWQHLRAGVVNMWEFETAEYWFAEGRAQLHGTNESGKTSLMAMTTLIMLSGDTSPRFIDTVGSSRSFRYYLQPNEHNDRRPALRALNQGWTWVEFGRTGPSGEEYYTLLLFASVRPGDRSPNLQWITLRGARVRQDFNLLIGGTVAVPATVKDVLPALELHRTAGDYKAALAAVLFSTTATELDTTVRLLTTLRTPKLGEKLDATFISEQIRSALPPLAESEIEKLADGWDELDRLNRDTANAAEAASALRAFARGPWRTWAVVATRRAADRLRTANYNFDEVTKQQRELGSQIEIAKKAAADSGAELEETEHERALTDRQRGVLLVSQAYADASTATENANHQRELADLVAEKAREASDRAEQSGNRAQEATTRAAEDRRAAERACTEADGATTSLSDELRRLGVSGDGLVDGELSKAAVAADGRRQDLEGLEGLYGLEAEAKSAHTTAVTVLDRQRQLLKEAGDRAARDQQQVDQLRTELTTALDLWAHRVEPPPPRRLVDYWVEAVDRAVTEPGTHPGLAAAVEASWAGPARRELDRQAGPLEREQALAAEELIDLESRLQELEAATEPEVEVPSGWARRDRSEGTGRALWQAVEVVDDADPGEVATLEAVLAATGLLDAWVTPDGSWLSARDGADAIITEGDGPITGRSLSALLRPAEQACDLSASVASFLAAVSWLDVDADLPQAGPAISADGRFSIGYLRGLATPRDADARLLGEVNRIALRARQIAELNNRRDDLIAARGRRQALMDKIEAAITAIATAVSRLPSERALMAAVSAAESSAHEQTRVQILVEEAEVDERRTDEDAAVALSARLRRSDELQIPPSTSSDRIRRLVFDLRTVPARLSALEKTIRWAADRAESASRSAGEAEELREIARIESGQATQAQRDWERQVKAAETAEEAVDKDHAAVLDEANALAERLGKLTERIKERTDLHATQRALAESLGQKLTELGPKGKEAQEARSESLTGFWSIVDAGLPPMLLRRPEELSGARTLTGGLECARILARELTPANWPTAPAIQEQEQTKTYGRMIGRMHELRSALEPLGISLRDVEPDDSTPGGVVVIVDDSGQQMAPLQAVVALEARHGRLEEQYDAQLQKNLTQLLGSAFLEHLQDRLTASRKLIVDINHTLAGHPTGTTRTVLRLATSAVDGDPAAAEVLRILSSGFQTLGEDAQDQVRQFLQARVNAARAEAASFGDQEWMTRLTEMLDYRRWENVVVETRSGAGRWVPLSRKGHDELSGGAKAVTLMAPLVAALAATYETMPGCARPLWLDEALHGVDETNRTEVLGMLAEFDMDWLLAGPNRIVAVATVATAALWEVVRAPDPEPGADLMVELWAGKTLRPLDLPDSGPPPDDGLGAPDGLFAALR